MPGNGLRLDPGVVVIEDHPPAAGVAQGVVPRGGGPAVRLGQAREADVAREPRRDLQRAIVGAVHDHHHLERLVVRGGLGDAGD